LRRLAVAAAGVALLLVAAACGGVRALNAPTVPPLPQGGSPTPTQVAGATPRARIVVVTHGQASDPFWAVVHRGVDDAAREQGISVAYEAPDIYDVGRMRQMIDTAVATHPAGLVVSLPDPQGLAPAIRQAVREGIPVISINSGSDSFRALGILLHVGQSEYAAGLGAGKRMAAEGVRHPLCVIQEAGNIGLQERYRGFAHAIAEPGGTSHALIVNLQNQAGAERAIAAALRGGRVDGLLTMGAEIATPALEALKATGMQNRIPYDTFASDSPDVLRAVLAGKIQFAVDQQPYLQGYLPIVLLAEYIRYGVLPAKGTLIPTGPVFVTKANADRVLALTRRGIR
jgi:simple sugar transport system substrate-binding protein